MLVGVVWFSLRWQWYLCVLQGWLEARLARIPEQGFPRAFGAVSAGEGTRQEPRSSSCRDIPRGRSEVTRW